MLTLAVTSSTSVVGVAIGGLGDDVADVVANQVETDRRHAEELTPLIDKTLRAAGVGISDLDLFVVDVGPGRFTGLRVGMATIRTLALAADKPVVGLTSLEILAWAESQRPVVAVIDARRSEVFQQRFDEAMTPSAPAVVGLPQDLAPLAEGALIVGDGADRYEELYGAVPGHGLSKGRAPLAAAMIGAAAGRTQSVGHEVDPVYLRDPDVNVNVKTRHTPR